MSATEYNFIGNLFFQSADTRGLYSMTSDKDIRPLPIDQQKSLTMFGISPNGEWIAYAPILVDEKGDQIKDKARVNLLSFRGERREFDIDIASFKQQLPEGYQFARFSSGDWINDTFLSTILMATREETDENATIIHIYSRMYIDTATGLENTDFLRWMKYPNIDYDFLPMYVISPDESKVVYETDILRENFAIELWDIEKQKRLFTQDLYLDGAPIAKWSPNTEFVAYTNAVVPLEEHQVYLATSDGAMNEKIFDNRYSNLIVNMEWSPNSRYLAMLGIRVPVNEERIYEIYIYDIDRGSLQLHCPFSTKEMTSFSRLVWAPDNSFVAYSGEDTMRMLRVSTGEVFDLLVNGSPFGWSGKFPAVW